MAYVAYCAFSRPSTVSELVIQSLFAELRALSYFCMSSLQTAPPPSLPLSLSLWRWGQRAISCALQTSLGGETLSTASAGAEQGSPGNKERHKLSSPLHPTVSHTKLFIHYSFDQAVIAFAMPLFLSLELWRENGWKNWAGWRWRFGLLQSLGKCLLRPLTYF